MKKKIKVYLIGVNGGVATALMLGIRSIIQGKFSSGGIATEVHLKHPNLLAIEDMEFGGCDIRKLNVYNACKENANYGSKLDKQLIEEYKDYLEAIPVYGGTAVNCGKVIQEMAGTSVRKEKTLSNIMIKMEEELLEFVGNKEAVVLNIASSEPVVRSSSEHLTLDNFEKGIVENSKNITASMIYAYVALKHKIPFINFTPSLGNNTPALKELALKTKTPHCGQDGKTGETLVKTALAPMFYYRALTIEDWQGINLLGNRDAEILCFSSSKEAKCETKNAALKGCLDYNPRTHVDIQYLKSLGD